MPETSPKASTLAKPKMTLPHTVAPLARSWQRKRIGTARGGGAGLDTASAPASKWSAIADPSSGIGLQQRDEPVKNSRTYQVFYWRVVPGRKRWRKALSSWASLHGGSRGQGQGYRRAAKELTEEVQGRHGGPRRVRAFLALLASQCCTALEFRHPSWFDDEVYGLL